MPEAVITFCGQKAKVCCDGKCHKAWGMNNRPKIQISRDEEDWAWKSDIELGDAPIFPGTIEGGHTKPKSSNLFPNKWCVRECERFEMSDPGQSHLHLKPRSFEERFYNIESPA